MVVGLSVVSGAQDVSQVDVAVVEVVIVEWPVGPPVGPIRPIGPVGPAGPAGAKVIVERVILVKVTTIVELVSALIRVSGRGSTSLVAPGPLAAVLVHPVSGVLQVLASPAIGIAPSAASVVSAARRRRDTRLKPSTKTKLESYVPLTVALNLAILVDPRVGVALALAVDVGGGSLDGNVVTLLRSGRDTQGHGGGQNGNEQLHDELWK